MRAATGRRVGKPGDSRRRLHAEVHTRRADAHPRRMMSRQGDLVVPLHPKQALTPETLALHDLCRICLVNMTLRRTIVMG